MTRANVYSPAERADMERLLTVGADQMAIYSHFYHRRVHSVGCFQAKVVLSLNQRGIKVPMPAKAKRIYSPAYDRPKTGCVGLIDRIAKYHPTHPFGIAAAASLAGMA